MSLLLYSKIPGTQVKRDANLSNATVQCDPTLLFPQGATQGGVLLNKENLAGKIAVEHDICNLDVNNLTVNGVLKAKGPAEVCDIVCPDTFSVVAVNQITMQALGNPSGDRGNIALIAGDDATIDQIPGTADECIMLSAASLGTQTQSADSQIMLTAGEGNSTQQGDNSILISAAGAGAQLQQSDNSILLTTNNGGVTQTIDGEIFLAAQSAILMEGVTDGIGLKFQENIVADNLKMTAKNVTTTGPANAQIATANAVTGTITLLTNTTINPPTGVTPVISCTLTNNKIAVNSTVLYSVNIAGNNSEGIVINGGGTTAGSYEFVLANLGANTYNPNNATERIVISFLVINPV